MSANRHRAGSRRPVYAGGFLYQSIFEASLETGISYPWIHGRLEASGGAPVLIRGLAVAGADWVDRIVGGYSDGVIRGYLEDTDGRA